MGALFKIPGTIVYYAAGLWGLYLCLALIVDGWGGFAAVIAFFLAPFVLLAVPWYAGFADGNWFPCIVIYGGGLLGACLGGIGDAIDSR